MKIKLYNKNKLKPKILEDVEYFLSNTPNIDNYKCIDFINNNKKTLCIIACHTNSDIKYNALLHNLQHLFTLSDNIVIINSLGYKHLNIEKKIKETYNNINIIYNNKLSDKLCDIYKNTYSDLKNLTKNELRNHWKNNGIYEGRDLNIPIKNIYLEYQQNDTMWGQSKWFNYLNRINYNLYKNVILTNDSIIITRPLDEIKSIIMSNDNYEMVSIIDSNEKKYHYTDFFRCYNINGIKKLLEYNEIHKHNNYNEDMLVKTYEIDTTYIFDKKKCIYNVDAEYDKNIHFDDDVYSNYIENNYPIIKIKKINSPIIVKYDTTFENILDFNPEEYKKINTDLNKVNNNDELIEHFKNFGMKEGRLYKKSQQNYKNHGYIQDILKKIGFRNF
jgi:hypothetical protein